jgi:hypothetical protein
MTARKSTKLPPYAYRAVRMWLRAKRAGDKKEKFLLQNALWQVKDFVDKQEELAIGDRDD